MDKPNLLATILKTVVSTPPPEGFVPSSGEIGKIVQLCEEFKFVSSNRSEFAQQIEQIVEEILGRESS
jgi:hypothetical protein